jgi:hypothetical protein
MESCMIKGKKRLAVIGLLLGAVLGCDSNPDGPSAPTKPNPGAADKTVTTAPGVLPKTAKGRFRKANPTSSPQPGEP